MFTKVEGKALAGRAIDSAKFGVTQSGRNYMSFKMIYNIKTVNGELCETYYFTKFLNSEKEETFYRNNLMKGSLISYIEFVIRNNNYQDASGKAVYGYNFVVTDMAIPQLPLNANHQASIDDFNQAPTDDFGQAPIDDFNQARNSYNNNQARNSYNNNQTRNSYNNNQARNSYNNNQARNSYNNNQARNNNITNPQATTQIVPNGLDTQKINNTPF